MNYRTTAILRIIVDRTYDEKTKKDCIDKMTEHFGLSKKANTLRKRLHHNDLVFMNAIEMFDYLKYAVYAENEFDKINLSSYEIVIQSISDIMKRDEISKVELARRLGISYRAVMSFFNRKNSKAETVVKVFNALNYKVVVESQTESGKRFIVGKADWVDYKFNIMLEDAEKSLTSEVI